MSADPAVTERRTVTPTTVATAAIKMFRKDLLDRAVQDVEEVLVRNGEESKHHEANPAPPNRYSSGPPLLVEVGPEQCTCGGPGSKVLTQRESHE
jgi:hypothetical protein